LPAWGDPRREIVELVRSGRRQQRLSLDPGAYAREVCGDDGLGGEALAVWLVRVDLPSGEAEVLATSLLDVQEFSCEEIAAIYSQRWRIEERILGVNLVQLMVGSAQCEVSRAVRRLKHAWKVNFKQAVSKSEGAVAPLLLRVRRTVIADLLRLFASGLEPLRPGRRFRRS
jgi:hypothetical protein